STRAISKRALSVVATNRQFSEGIRTPTRSPHEDPCQSAGYRHARSDWHCGHKAAGPTANPIRAGAITPAKFAKPFYRPVHRPAASGPASVWGNAKTHH